LELVVALVAVAKSGAAFLPLDPDHPQNRLRYMIDDARPAAVLDDPAAIRAARDTRNVGQHREIDTASWAYVLYTSRCRTPASSTASRGYRMPTRWRRTTACR
jgi:non-ribosomal peptide synthetase component F